MNQLHESIAVDRNWVYSYMVLTRLAEIERHLVSVYIEVGGGGGGGTASYYV